MGIGIPRGFNTPGTGELIRDHLLTVQSASVQECWQRVRAVCQMHGWQYPAYDHFTKYFWKLKKAGLVIEDHREKLDAYEGDEHGHPNYHAPRTSRLITERRFYRIVKSKAGSAAWDNPQKALYG